MPNRSASSVWPPKKSIRESLNTRNLQVCTSLIVHRYQLLLGKPPVAGTPTTGRLMAPALTADNPGLDLESALLVEGGRLYAIALAILRDAGEAEDAVQETMELAWRSRSSLRSTGSQMAWLTRICVRQSLHRRRRWFRAGHVAGDASMALLAPLAPFVPRDVDLDRALGRLSAQQRAVLA